MPTTLPSGRRPDPTCTRRYDGETRDWLMAKDGNFSGSHPVDQMVAMSFACDKGDCGARREVGNGLRKVGPLTADNLEQQIDVAVRDAYPFSALLTANRIALRSIAFGVVEKSKLWVVVNYKNLELDADSSARWNQ